MMGPLADFESMRCIEKTYLQLKSETRWSNLCKGKHEGGFDHRRLRREDPLNLFRRKTVRIMKLQ